MVFTDEELKNEKWKAIERFNGYEVSNLGRIKSNYGTERIREIQKNNYGDAFVLLTEKEDGNYTFSGLQVGKEVAKAFIPNPEQYKYIRFKDGNKMNCRADNIEWCEITDKMRKTYQATEKPIHQYDENGNYMRTWNNAGEIAEKYHVSRSVIYASCSKKTSNLICGCVFRYASEYPTHEKIDVIIRNKNAAVEQYSKDGIFLKKFNSITEAVCSLGEKAYAGNITACCKGNRATAYGYIWKYSREEKS